jgi:hypothetical protein
VHEIVADPDNSDDDDDNIQQYVYRQEQPKLSSHYACITWHDHPRRIEDAKMEKFSCVSLALRVMAYVY